jgi:hypothetical protein
VTGVHWRAADTSFTSPVGRSAPLPVVGSPSGQSTPSACRRARPPCSRARQVRPYRRQRRGPRRPGMAPRNRRQCVPARHHGLGDALRTPDKLRRLAARMSRTRANKAPGDQGCPIGVRDGHQITMTSAPGRTAGEQTEGADSVSARKWLRHPNGDHRRSRSEQWHAGEQGQAAGLWARRLCAASRGSCAQCDSSARDGWVGWPWGHHPFSRLGLAHRAWAPRHTNPSRPGPWRPAIGRTLARRGRRRRSRGPWAAPEAR